MDKFRIPNKSPFIELDKRNRHSIIHIKRDRPLVLMLLGYATCIQVYCRSDILSRNIHTHNKNQKNSRLPQERKKYGRWKKKKSSFILMLYTHMLLLIMCRLRATITQWSGKKCVRSKWREMDRKKLSDCDWVILEIIMLERICTRACICRCNVYYWACNFDKSCLIVFFCSFSHRRLESSIWYLYLLTYKLKRSWTMCKAERRIRLWAFENFWKLYGLNEDEHIVMKRKIAM